MTELLLEILLPILSTILTSLSGAIVWLIKQKKKEYLIRKELEERQSKINEKYNKTAGVIEDQLNLWKSKKSNGEYAIKLEPDVREGLIKTDEQILKEYHYFDRVKL